MREIARRRKALFDTGRIRLVPHGRVGRMVPIEQRDQAVADEYNRLAKEG